MSGKRDKICDELGDLLLQVVFHAQIAAEEGSFTFVMSPLASLEKMVRRHPHVFGDGAAKTDGDVRANWEQIKAEERQQENGKDSGVLTALR